MTVLQPGAATDPRGVPASTPPGTPPVTTVASGPRSQVTIYLWLALAAAILAVGSMAFAWSPSYDPWAWIIWGRELLHGSLSTTFGPSFKPLPVLFTTPFALLGAVAPALWVALARWGAIFAVLLCSRLATRIALLARGDRPWPQARLARLAALSPALLGGLLAAAGLALTSAFAEDSANGYSEGLAIAFTLIAIERGTAGHHRQAFALGTVIAWDRPESWLAWGPYGLWLMWHDRGARALVIGLALATLAAWFLPPRLFGENSLTSSISRAQNIDPGTPQTASFPFAAELWQRALPSVIGRAKLIVLAAVLVAVAPLLRRRLTLREWLTDPQSRAGRWITLLAGAGAAWWLVICVETQTGFSGNARYMRVGAALVYVAAGGALGWGTYALARWLGERRRDAHPPAVQLLATGAAAVAVLFLPTGFIGRNLTSPSGTRSLLRYQALKRNDLIDAIRAAGGRQRVVACGQVMAQNYLVPEVAWYLQLRIDQVNAEPATVNAASQAPVAPGRWPAVIVQTSATPHGIRQPLLSEIAGWQSQGARYIVTNSPRLWLYRDCRTGS